MGKRMKGSKPTHCKALEVQFFKCIQCILYEVLLNFYADGLISGISPY